MAAAREAPLLSLEVEAHQVPDEGLHGDVLRVWNNVAIRGPWMVALLTAILMAIAMALGFVMRICFDSRTNQNQYLVAFLWATPFVLVVAASIVDLLFKLCTDSLDRVPFMSLRAQLLASTCSAGKCPSVLALMMIDGVLVAVLSVLPMAITFGYRVSSGPDAALWLILCHAWAWTVIVVLGIAIFANVWLFICRQAVWHEMLQMCGVNSVVGHGSVDHIMNTMKSQAVMIGSMTNVWFPALLCCIIFFGSSLVDALPSILCLIILFGSSLIDVLRNATPSHPCSLSLSPLVWSIVGCVCFCGVYVMWKADRDRRHNSKRICDLFRKAFDARTLAAAPEAHSPPHTGHFFVGYAVLVVVWTVWWIAMHKKSNGHTLPPLWIAISTFVGVCMTAAFARFYTVSVSHRSQRWFGDHLTFWLVLCLCLGIGVALIIFEFGSLSDGFRTVDPSDVGCIMTLKRNAEPISQSQLQDSLSYPLCRNRYGSQAVSVLQLGVLSWYAYADNHQQINGLLEMSFGGPGRFEVLQYPDEHPYLLAVRLTPQGNASSSTLVIAARGTDTRVDVNADASMYATVFSLQLMSKYIVPILTLVPKEISSWAISSTNHYDVSRMADEVSRSIQKILSRRRPGDHVVLTGHSLGGLHAEVAGALLDLRTVVFSAPGFGSMSWTLSLDPHAQNKYEVIVPDYDPVPRVDEHTGVQHHINCRGPNGGRPKGFYLMTQHLSMSCHSVTRTICELYYHCGSESNDFNCPGPR